MLRVHHHICHAFLPGACNLYPFFIVLVIIALLTAPFLRGDSQDEAHRLDRNTEGPFVRHVLLGDRGRARCSWAVRQQFLR